MSIPFNIYDNNDGYCANYNYIPRPLPIHINYENWRNTYNKQLQEMFMLCIKIIHYNKINYIDWDNNEIYDEFTKLIFYSSSKYISKYI